TRRCSSRMARIDRGLRPARLGKTETGSSLSDTSVWSASRKVVIYLSQLQLEIWALVLSGVAEWIFLFGNHDRQA
ncbi:hypothetical protein, partial [Hyphomonas beringensis]|uniref:hypothetical protein n=1 Tax=Hyphomonas beringensis TaxID=1280946 RepID=UPI0019D6DFDD